MNERAANVHYIETVNGVPYYGVGIFNLNQGQYNAPLDAESRRLTGCFAEYSRKPIGRFTLHDAGNRARELWGYCKVAE